MHFPISFYIALATILALGFELFLRRREPWALPVAAIYATVFGWYFVDFLGYRERYEFMPDILVERAFWHITLFLLCFRLLAPTISRRLVRGVLGKTAASREFPYEWLLIGTLAIWAILFVIGLGTMNWDVGATLFPLDARNGNKMWDRPPGASAGQTGFLISTANYVYLLVCSFFGILLILDRRVVLRVTCVAMILLTWPYFLLGGTRNQFLAVAMPTMFAYTLFSKHKLFLKGIVLLICFLALDSAFRIVLKYRNVGYRTLLESEESGENDVEGQGLNGLNMFEELCFINAYCYSGMPPTLGKNYLANALNFVPRAIWPGKPMVGVEYSIWRGAESIDSDVGFATGVSSGIIGEGVLEFGPYFGPIAPAVLIALWAALLTRWWCQRASTLRLILFLVGMGVTFNLGRNITLVILWPVIFGYVIVRIAECFAQAPQPVPAHVWPAQEAAKP
jgi:hypothetical protein